jgi:EAL domain-containing protein (putative c-di-GMP-specific phosphodiesterase class I)
MICNAFRLGDHRDRTDPSFIKGLPDDHTSMTLTRTIIGLASAFGLLTVAEGVETAEQFKLRGC